MRQAAGLTAKGAGLKSAGEAKVASRGILEETLCWGCLSLLGVGDGCRLVQSSVASLSGCFENSGNAASETTAPWASAPVSLPLAAWRPPPTLAALWGSSPLMIEGGDLYAGTSMS